MNESRSKQTPSSSVELVSGGVQRFTRSVQLVSGPTQSVSHPVRRVNRLAQRASVGVRCVSSRVQRVPIGVQRGIYSVATPSRLLFHVSTESERTPNHALQRTAPRVTVAADSGLGVFTPSHHCPTSVAVPFAPPAQLPRHAPPSLSLGSLGYI